MKKAKILVIAFSMAFVLCGCSNALSTANVAKEKVENMLNENNYKDVEVHTKEEMCDFALGCLKDKYGKEFVIDYEKFCKYKEGKDTDSGKALLKARAYPVDAPSEVCGFTVEEPNKFKDDYYAYLYKDEIKEIIDPQLEKYGLEHDFQIYNDVQLAGLPDENITAEEFLANKGTEIWFDIPVDEQEDVNDYLPTIRKWLDFLYSTDEFDWYFSLCSKDEFNKYYFTLKKGDGMKNSSDEWTDEELLTEIDRTINL